MSKTSNKTVPAKGGVAAYVKSLSAKEQEMATELIQLFSRVTNMKPVMWGSMVGFGSYHYKYESGREGDFFATGFAMRKSGPTIYIMSGYQNYAASPKKIDPHKLGKSCLYLKDLENIDRTVLQKLIATGLADLAKKYLVSS